MERASEEARRIDRLMRWGTATGEDDGRLLERFRLDRDESAFAALVDRHGPMVLGVCRRILRDDQDVEDAFQATFLVLVRRAGTIRGADRVGPWIHGVAHRVAVRARAVAARRYVREGVDLDVEPAVAVTPSGAVERSELRSILDEELGRLPERLRAPLILCHLEGLTHEQAAARLQQPVGTIRSRLSRGRDRLRDRLTRRGVSAESVTASLMLADPVPSALLEAAVRSSLSFASSRPDALTSAGAAVLASGVLDAMIATKLKITAALASLLALSGASGYALQQGSDGKVRTPIVHQTNSQQPTESVLEPLAADLAKAKANLEDLKSKRYRLEKEIETASEIIARVQRRLLKVPGKSEAVSSTARVGGLGINSAMIGWPYSPVASGSPTLPVRQSVDPFATQPTLPGTNVLATPRLVMVPSRNGHVVTGYSAETGETRTLRLADDASGGIDVVPIVGMSLAALRLKGDSVGRVAVFSVSDGEWHPRDLAEPTGEAIPFVCPAIVVYRIGRRMYAFSGIANRWDMLELPEPLPRDGISVFNPDIITCLSHEGRLLHIFGAKTGKWTSIDVEKLPEATEPQPNATPAQ